MSTEPTTPEPTPDTRSAAEIEADIARTRAELQATIDQLTNRLAPKNLAQDALDDAQAAFDELRRKATQAERPVGAKEPTTLGWALLGTAAALAALVVVKVVRRF